MSNPEVIESIKKSFETNNERSDVEVSDHEDIESKFPEELINIEQTLDWAKTHKFTYKGFNYLLWKNPMELYDSLTRNVNQHQFLKHLQKELKEIMEDWMNQQEAQALPIDCPYMSSWDSLYPILSSRPYYTISSHLAPILKSLEKMASKREAQKTKELCAIIKLNTGCDTSGPNLKKRKVKISCIYLYVYSCCKYFKLVNKV